MLEDKTDSYAAADAATDCAERLKRRMSGDMRFRVRRLAHTEPFSQTWVDQLDPLKYLATVATSEHLAAVKEREAGPPQGRGPGGGPVAQLGVADAAAAATIWERDEVCVRIIVEEGKINLLMRAMVEYKEVLYATGFPGLEFEAYGRLYEHSLGQLLKCAMYALECLQTLDIRAVLDHIAAVLKHSGGPDHGPPPDAIAAPELASQECVVPIYLAQIFAHIDDLDADVIVDKVIELDLISLARRHCAKYHRTAPVVAAHLAFLAHLVDTESFKTCLGKSVFAAKDERRAFCADVDPTLKAHLLAFPDKKRSLRPLSDFILRHK